MWSLIDGKHFVSVLNHDGLLVDRVDKGLDDSSRQEQHTKGQDAQQLQALTRPHCMQNRTKKQHKESKHLLSRSQTLK